jgi:hypothetical protein
MPNRSHLKRKKRSKINIALLSRKKLVNFIKNLTRRRGKKMRRSRRQRGG